MDKKMAINKKHFPYQLPSKLQSVIEDSRYYKNLENQG